MSTRKCFLTVIFCVFAFTCNGFSQVRLQGVVTDNGSEPVFNALVEIINQVDTTQKHHDHTDKQGVYEIPDTDVDGFITNKPGHFNLLQNYPNPFNPSTVIGFELSHPSIVRIDIYNVLGRKVKTLVDGFQNIGPGRVVWDATDDGGQGIPAGVYIYSLKAEGIRINRKMLLIDGRQCTSGGMILQQAELDIHDQTVSKNVIPDKYLLRVTGSDIQTYEQPNIEIVGDTTVTINITVNRTVTDIDGNVYRTVKIGNQWWMAENLKVTHYRNGDEIPNVTDNTEWSALKTGAYCVYNNDYNNMAVRGCLYNWYAVNDGRKIAPEGWHVFSDAEWKELEMYLGMSQQDADIAWWRGTVAGKLKETGTTHWKSPNAGATNESGFTALAGGLRSWLNGSFLGINDYIFDFVTFWTSTKDKASVWYYRLTSDDTSILRDKTNLKWGFSVRCLRD